MHATKLGHKSSGVNDITMELKYFHLIGDMTSNILRVATEARALTLGPFSPSFKVSFLSSCFNGFPGLNLQKCVNIHLYQVNQIMKEGLDKLLPNDVHTKV